VKILVTAFMGLGPLNASRLALEAMADSLGRARITKLILPTAFHESTELLIQAIQVDWPDAGLCLGQAGRRAALTPERVAINLMDARIPDVRGFQPVVMPIVPGGPAAYFSDLPLKAMVAAIQAAGLPGEISNTAGTFVCNALMYGLLHKKARHFPQLPCGFMHLPVLPRPEGPGMPTADSVRGIEAAILAMLGALQA